MHKLIHLHKVKNLYKARLTSFNARTTQYPSDILTHKILSRDFKKNETLNTVLFLSCLVVWCSLIYFSPCFYNFSPGKKNRIGAGNFIVASLVIRVIHMESMIEQCFVVCQQFQVYAVLEGPILRAPKFHGGIIDNCGDISR